MHRQGIPDIDLFIEQDTDRTPEPKRFYVILKGEVLGSFGTLRAATKRYKEIKETVGYSPPLPPQPSQQDIDQAILDEWLNRTEVYWTNSSSHRPTGKVRR